MTCLALRVLRVLIHALALFAQGAVSCSGPLPGPRAGRRFAPGPLHGLRAGPCWGSRDRLGAILCRLGVDLGGGEVPGTSAGPSRGALFANLTFFASEVDLWSILPLPRSLWRALWPPLGAVWAALVPLGTPLGASKGALGVAWAPSWGAFWRSWATLGPLKAPGMPW